MQVLRAFPPNYKAINKKFKVRGRFVLFAYGNIIYNPMGALVPPELHAHEKVHSEQQGDTPNIWWEHYIDNDIFRLQQEIPAHAAELYAMGRSEKALDLIAWKLSSPLYGELISFKGARELLGRHQWPIHN